VVAKQKMARMRNKLKRSHKKRTVLQRNIKSKVTKSITKRHKQVQELKRKISVSSIIVKKHLLLEVNNTFCPTMVIGQTFKIKISRDKLEIKYSPLGKKIMLILGKVAVACKVTLCQGPDHRTIIIWFKMKMNRPARLNNPERQSSSNNSSKKAFRSGSNNNSKQPR
jgi:hypothetical protein